jgi:uncharacterized protein (DUF58 family)
MRTHLPRAAVAIGLGLALCLIAAAFGAPPLYVPGITFLLTAAVGGIWVARSARGVRVERSIGAPAVQEDEPLRVSVRALRGRLPLPGAEVRAWPGAPAAALTRAREVILDDALRFERRGRHVLGPATALIGDPLGLWQRSVVSPSAEVLVLPRLEPVRLLDVGGHDGMLAPTRGSSAELGASEVDSLRPHRSGTPASRIHWPTVARAGVLMERRLVTDSDERPLIVVDPRAAVSPEALDTAVRAAASLCVYLARQGGCAVLLGGDRAPTRVDPELFGFSALHARLALLEPSAGAPALGPLGGASVVLWVSAAREAPALLSQLRAGTRYYISPQPEARWRVRFTVAGCSGQRVERAARGGREAA